MRGAADAGHEIGLHAWDHYTWQAKIEKMNQAEIRQALERGFDALTKILGSAPVCSAVPAWKCTDQVLLAKEKFPFKYNSDCRGQSLFRPVVGSQALRQPQVPVTLPTYDEVIGRDGITPACYNDYLISLMDPIQCNVLTVHAEVEGMTCAPMFADFLTRARARGARFMPLGDLLAQVPVIHPAGMVARAIRGREGWVACQAGMKEVER
jgi:undecaprenyl phosphate-alpha-L-ara4FN deformylase